jgi:hypothetical protein
MKRIVATLVLICACHASFADTSGDWTYTVSNNQATITGYTGAGGAVTIPSSVNGIPVFAIGGGWPPIHGGQFNTSIQSVVIANGITRINSWAFYRCQQLRTVTMPESIIFIGSGAFSGCWQLDSVTLPSQLQIIEDQAFSSCNIKSLDIPSSVVQIGECAFSGNEYLDSLTLHEGLVTIGMGAFSYGGYREIFIPSTVQAIGFQAFVSSNLTKINLPERLAYLIAVIVSSSDNISPIREIVLRDKGSQYLYPELLNSLAANSVFINTLANNDAFVTAVANKIKGTVGTYGLATQTELGTLATKSEITTAINEGKSAGIASVTASPNTWSLFTSSQIQNMAIGDLVLTREVNGNFVLNYDIEQSNDLANWTVYSANTQIVKLPADKAFVRIKAKQ